MNPAQAETETLLCVGITPADDPSEAALLEALRAVDENAFLALVNRYHASMVRVASSFVSSPSVAEEVAQEAWLGVLTGVARFEGRSSLKSWIFKILTNCAKTRAVRERRSVPFSSLVRADQPQECSVEPERFFDADHPEWPGRWALPPRPWAEQRLLSLETLELLRRAIELLPDAQRTVITLRDVEGWNANEVCETLAITETNQRVLLHRARSQVLRALEPHMNSLEGRPRPGPSTLKVPA